MRASHGKYGPHGSMFNEIICIICMSMSRASNDKGTAGFRRLLVKTSKMDPETVVLILITPGTVL